MSSAFPSPKQSLLERSDSDALLPVTIGTGIWAIALVVLIAIKDQLDAAGNGWWVAVAATGVVLGAGGLAFLMWRRNRSGVTQL